MKRKNRIIWVGLAFFSCISLLSCKTENQTSIRIEEKIIDVDTTSELKPQNDSLAINEQVLNKISYSLERTKEFFVWYKKNRKDFYNNQSACVYLTEDNFYKVDTTKVEFYIDYLKSSGFFSKTFTDEVKKSWLECQTDMEKDMSEGITAEGPPNCVYEGDIIFKIQEDPIDEMYNQIEYNVVEIDSLTQEVKTNSTIFVWELKNGVWSIKNFY